MKTKKPNASKKAGSGSTATGRYSVVTTQLSEDLIKSLDDWALKEKMSRGEAARWIIADYFNKRAATRVL